MQSSVQLCELPPQGQEQGAGSPGSQGAGVLWCLGPDFMLGGVGSNIGYRS